MTIRRLLPPARPFGWAALLALAAAGCGPNAQDAYRQVKEQAKQQGTTIASLRELGAKIEEKPYTRGHKAWTVDLSGIQLPEDVFQSLKRIKPITELNLSKTNVTDAQMDSVNDPDIGALLLKLDLSQTDVSDAGLEKLTHLALLQDLNLTQTKVTAEGVERFRTAHATNQRLPQQLRSLTIQH